MLTFELDDGIEAEGTLLQRKRRSENNPTLGPGSASSNLNPDAREVIKQCIYLLYIMVLILCRTFVTHIPSNPPTYPTSEDGPYRAFSTLDPSSRPEILEEFVGQTFSPIPTSSFS